MSTLIDTPRSAGFRDGFIFVVLQSGAELRFPASENPRFTHATPAQLNNIELSPFGLHWPDLDEDLSIRGIALQVRSIYGSLAGTRPISILASRISHHRITS
jgi:hypothetical protein